MKSGTTLLLFLVGAFALVIVLIKIPAYTMFTGGIFILLFVVGLLLALFNAIREGQKFAKKVQSETTAAH
jgi:membrane-bound ClpP family serine protease